MPGCSNMRSNADVIEFETGRYVEWEKYPERKAKAAEILRRHKFSPIPGMCKHLYLSILFLTKR